MKEKMIEFLRDFLIQNNWCDKYTKEQGRSMFTAICLFCNIDADTAECDEIISYVYEEAEIVETIDFDDLADYGSFKRYMLELIV